MLADIVERLSNWKHASLRRDGSTLETMHEAAEAITTLRARVKELELNRQAIIKDFVSKLGPVGYLSRESEYRLTHYGGNDSKGTVPIHLTNKKGKHTPLYDLSEWINK